MNVGAAAVAVGTTAGVDTAAGMDTDGIAVVAGVTAANFTGGCVVGWVTTATTVAGSTLATTASGRGIA